MPRLTKIIFSEEAQRIMARGFAAHKPAKAILGEISKATGEHASVGLVQKRAAQWRAKIENRRWTRESLYEFVEKEKAAGRDGSEILMALAILQLEQEPDMLQSADPIQVQRLGLQGEALHLRKRQVEVQEHKVELEKRRLAMVEERERRAIAALEAKHNGEELSPEERIARVRAIYGLSDAAA